MAEYIEREAAQAECKKYKFSESYDAFVVDCILKSIPAADVAPVRHGRWYWAKDGHCKCSVCEQYATVKRLVVKTNYCPNCGAKMDGGTN